MIDQTTTNYWWLAGAIAVCVAATKYISYRRDPLFSFPGPLFAALSNLPYSYHMMLGDHPKWITALHEKYGPVVRVGPTELAFNTTTSWRDIYCYRKGHKMFTKSGAYDAAAFTAQTRSIVNEQDPAEHAKMRKMVAPAFSERSLQEQHPLVVEITDKFIEEIRKRQHEPVDLGMWFGLVTFDIITDLALGESFHAVDAGKLHPWASFFSKGARAMGEGVAVMRFPWLKRLVLAAPPPQMKAMIKELRMHEDFTTKLVEKREQNPIDRPDILGRIISHQDEEKFSTAYVAAQLSDFVIAGTDTTATALATANYFLMKDKNAMQKLQSEIRGRFQQYEDITPASTTNLKYLDAVVNEALRMLPPVAWAPSRIVPPGGSTVDGYLIPAGTWVSTGYFSAAHSPDSFKDPWQFRPERWIDPTSGDKLDGSQPFSLGTRSCIGKQLAWVEMRLIMAKLHFTYDMTLLDQDLDWIRESKMHILWKKPSLRIQVRERNSL